jgi:hypothetical protein
VNQWLNRSHPQTLQNATILCYIEAIFGLFLGGVVATDRATALAIIVGLAVGGFGIANDKRWGYYVAIGAAVLHVANFFRVFGLSWLRDGSYIISFGFAAALVALLLHPQSREYQKIWFR